MSVSIAENCDNMHFMSKFEDSYFELAIVYPPYGIDMGNYNRTLSDRKGSRHTKKDWDVNIPTDAYFKELFRVSKNQIIWGGNYFPSIWVNGCKGFIFWNKHQPVQTFADGEMAWCSVDKPARCFDFPYYGNLSGKKAAGVKIHSTQKPVELYEWLLKNYASSGDKILDTHLGSGSSRIAAKQLGFDFYSCELDAEYFNKQEERFERFCAQVNPFAIAEPTKEQTHLF